MRWLGKLTEGMSCMAIWGEIFAGREKYCGSPEVGVCLADLMSGKYAGVTGGVSRR